MLALTALHVGGDIVASLRHGENPVGAMWTGRKTGRPGRTSLFLPILEDLSLKRRGQAIAPP